MTDDALDVAAVDRWVRSAAPAVPPLVRSWMISGGRSNLTYGLEDETGARYCLRRPPLGDVPATAHDVAREHRLIAALADTDVPVPPAVGVCTDTAVIGAPFYLMRFVDGAVVATDTDADALAPDVRAAVGPAMVDALAAVHRVDLDAVGLGDLRRPATYVARQVRRWRGQLTDDDVRARPLLVAVADALSAQEPEAHGAGLIHGDFKMGNCVLSPTGGVAAVLDWELCSVGDTLADIGWLVASWADPGEDRPRIVTPPTTAGGFATRRDVADRYAKEVGRDVGDLDYWVALAEWRWACIDVGIHKRYAGGAMPGQTIDLDLVAAEIDDRVASAAQLLGVSA